MSQSGNHQGRRGEREGGWSQGDGWDIRFFQLVRYYFGADLKIWSSESHWKPLKNFKSRFVWLKICHVSTNAEKWLITGLQLGYQIFPTCPTLFVSWSQNMKLCMLLEVLQKPQLPIWSSQKLSFWQQERNVTNPAAIHKIWDFSNVSGTHLSLIPKYRVLNITGSLSKTSTLDFTGRKCDIFSGDWAGRIAGELAEYQTFSTCLIHIRSYIHQYLDPVITGSLSKTSSRNVTFWRFLCFQGASGDLKRNFSSSMGLYSYIWDGIWLDSTWWSSNYNRKSVICSIKESILWYFDYLEYFPFKCTIFPAIPGN